MITAASKVDGEAIIGHYEELDPFYREVWGEHVHHGLWQSGRETVEEATEHLVEHVAERAQLRPGDVVCDIGSGYGATARLLAARFGARVTAMTLVPAQYAYARSAAPGSDNPTYVLGDWLENGLPGAHFDAALAIESTEHMADKARAFAEAFRVLRPGGRLVVCAWIAREQAAPWQERLFLEPICREGRLAGLGTETDYRALLTGAGFSVEQVDEVSEQVQRTWSICTRRVLHRIAVDERYRAYLRDRARQHRIFVWTVPRLWAAYRAGVMRYLIFTARRPGGNE